MLGEHNRVRVTFLISLGFLSGEISASTQFHSPSFVSTASLGIGLSNGIGSTQTFNLTNAILKSYSLNQRSQHFFYGSLFIGSERNISRVLRRQIGIEIAGNSRINLSGLIFDEANPSFDNHRFQYRINHSRLGIKYKLATDTINTIRPWVAGMIGVSFNHANSFNNVPLIPQALANENFKDNTVTSLSYSLSAGLEISLNKLWFLGLGYEYDDWGRSALGKTQGQELNTGIAFGHVYTHKAVVALTYKA